MTQKEISSSIVLGTENPADDETRFEVGVNKETGGSFCVSCGMECPDERDDTFLWTFSSPNDGSTIC